jgi:amidophosphoribosyltransferase
MRISCPPTISPCFYGVDTPRRAELIAATHSLEEIRKYLDADSVAYLSLDGLADGVRGGRTKYCTSCYTGEYPVAFPRNEAAYLQLALKLNGTGDGVASHQPAIRDPQFEKDSVPG